MKSPTAIQGDEGTRTSDWQRRPHEFSGNGAVHWIGFDDAAAVPGTSPTSLYLPITEIVDVTTIAQLAQG